MEKTISFLLELKSLGIRVAVESGKLMVDAPKGVMTAEIAKSIQQNKQAIIDSLHQISDGQGQMPVFEKNEQAGLLPLSDNQEQLWVVGRLEGQNPLYNIPTAIRLKGHFDLQAAQKALEAVAQRHEALRVTFHQNDDGQGVQQVHEKPITNIAFEDLSQLKGAAQQQALDQEIETYTTEPFVLEKLPLMRAACIRLAEEEHVFLMVMHHIIADYGTIAILQHEFSTLYDGEVTGKPAQLPPVPYQYSDYALWQRKYIQTAAFKHKLQFWENHLADAPAVLQLPADKQRSIKRSYQGGSVSITWGADLTTAIKAQSTATQTTLYMGLQAALSAFLHRYSGQAQVVVGSSAANRMPAETEGIMGFFVNMLPLKTDFEGDPSFKQHLQNVKAISLEALQNQDVPFQKMLETLEVKRNTGYSPVFQVVLNLQNYQADNTLIMSGLSITPYPLSGKVAKYDITFIFKEETEGLSLLVEYSTSLFEEATIRQMVDRFEYFATELTGQPDTPITLLPLESPEETAKQLLVNNVSNDYPADASIAELFEAQAAKYPDHIAIIEKRKWTYTEVHQEANKLAFYLIEKIGVKKGDRVALLLDRSPEMIIGMLAVLKAGALYVPLDPAHPEKRIRHIMEAVAPIVILTVSDYKFDFDYFDGTLYKFDLQQATLETPANNPEVSVTGDDPCYIMYTSGSTGNPKGVVAKHRGVTRLVNNTNYVEINPDDRLLALSSYAFDGSTFDIYGALLNGAALVMPSKEEVLELPKLMQRAVEAGVTLFFTTTALFNTLVDTQLESLGGLRKILFGGERASLSQIDKFFKAYGPGILTHVYGPTENTTFSTWYPVDSVNIEHGNLPIGKPIANSTMYVVDSQGQLQPKGLVGELWVGGDGLAAGYWANDEGTKERFLPDPFDPGRKVYCTGDLVSMLQDGNIEFIGRVDQQVKIRGFRIEPDEIAHQISLHPVVSQAVVVVSEVGNSRELWGYYSGEKAVSEQAMRKYLQGQLPEYMIPVSLMSLEAMPLNPNGKVDKKALPKPEKGGEHKTALSKPPASATEQLVAGIWEDELSVQNVMRGDNFFSLGGDSIKAIRVIAALNRATDRELEVKDLFSQQTLSAFAGFMDAPPVDTGLPGRADAEQWLQSWKSNLNKGEGSDYDLLSSAEDYYPISDIQSGMLFYTLYNPGGGTYHVQQFHHWEMANFDISRFKSAYRMLLARHAIFRTSFHLQAFEEPLQVVHSMEDLEVNLTFESLETLTEQSQKEAFTSYMKEDHRKGFEIDKPGLLRTGVFALGNNQYSILLTFHHAIMDGWSDATLMAELWKNYLALESTPDYKPLPLPVSYRDYVLDQWRYQQAPFVQQWWATHFEGFERMPLPFYKRPNPELTQQKRGYGFPMPQQTIDTVTQLGKELGFTFKQASLAATLATLYHYTGHHDLVIGMMSHGRPELPEAERMMGCFLNSVPVRVAASFDSVGQWVKSIGEHIATLKSYDKLPLLQIQKLVKESKHLGNPIFDILFSYLDFHVLQENEHKEGQRDKAGSIVDGTAITNTHLDIAVARQGEQAFLSFNYDSNLFKEEEIKQLGDCFLRFMETLAHNPDEGLTSRNLLGDDEITRLLSLHDRTEKAWDQEATLLSHFHTAVMAHDSRIALAFGDEEITYRALDQQSNRLAHLLRERGVGAEKPVGILFERGADMVVAILAVLKSGGAYLPIDPSLPSARIDFILNDAQPTLVITDCKSTLNDLSISSQQWLILKETEWGHYPDSALEVTVAPDNLAYIIYTSGSTGKPKGVEVEHRQVSRLLFCEGFDFDFGPEDVWTLFHSISFDFSVWELWGPLLRGGKLVVLPKSTTQNPTALMDALVQYRVTVLNQVPTIFGQLWGAITASDSHPALALRYVIFGGEALQPSMLAGFHAQYPDTRLVNMYGITETTVHVTYKEIGTREISEGISNIGRVLPNLRICLLGDNRQLVAQGAVGEIVIGGAGLARGYLNRQMLTAERFVQDPYRPGERLYLSGDLAMINELGELVYMGRKDQQVKVRGYRIELGEITDAMLQLDGVTSAATLVQTDDQGDKTLIAYVTGEAALNANTLKAGMEATLPPYMLPARFVRIEALPYTSNGKLDTKALSQIEGELRGTKDYVGPRNEIEKRLVKVWERQLGVQDIGIRDNYFVLGGDSIKVIRLAGAIKEAFGQELEIKAIFQHPTIEQQAAYLGEAQTNDNHHEAWLQKLTDNKVAILDNSQYAKRLPQGWEDVYPMADIVQGMFFHMRLYPEAAMYHDQFFYSFKDENFKLTQLIKAFQILVSRHEILRSSFYLDGFAQPMQVVHTPTMVDISIPIQDLQGQNEEQQQATMQAFAQADRQKPFDEREAGLWRLCVFQTGQDSYVLLKAMHHAIIDGWSNASLVTELAMVQARLAKGDTDGLPPLKASYKDYVAAQLRIQQDESVRQWWTVELENYERTPLPLQKQVRKLPTQFQKHTIQWELPADLTRQIDECAQQKDISVKNLLFAAFVLFMQRSVNRREVAVGILSHGRPPIADGDKILGCFLNSVTFRNDGKADTVADFLQEINAKSNELKGYDQLSLAQIAGIAGEETHGQNPLFDTLFTYLDFHVTGQIKGLFESGGQDPESYTLNNTLFDFVAYKMDSKHLLQFVVLEGLYDSHELEMLQQAYLMILEQLVAEENQQLENIAWITEGGVPLSVWEGPGRPRDSQNNWQEALKQAATKYPEKQALVNGQEVVGFGELDSTSAQWAAYLVHKLGVEEGDVVAVAMPRSIAAVVSIFAVMKAGAAFLPIDADTPKERIQLMISDAGARYIISNDLSEITDADIIRTATLSSQSGLETTALAYQPTRLAYLIYTSGSTGKPKGVRITHRSLHNYWISANETYVNQQSSDVPGALFTSLAFDLTITALLGTILRGDTLHIYTGEASEELPHIMASVSPVRMVKLTPAHVTILADTGMKGSLVKTVIVGGDVFTVAQYKALQMIAPQAEVYNEYGPTEATVGCIVKNVRSEQDLDSIGVPMPNTNAYVVDQWGQLLPMGMSGELCIGGIVLAEGYHGRDALTEERFVRLGALPEKVYRTGDLTKATAQGEVAFLGRADNQVKINGYRIEAGEVEAAIRNLASVEDAVVLLQSHGKQASLAAWVQSRQPITTMTIRDGLAKQLPSYMIPAAITVLEAMPLTANGKVDRKALAATSMDARPEESYVAPVTPTESLLAGLWSDVLGKESVGAEDNFFHIGGNSLSATRIAERYYQRSGMRLPIRDLFTYPVLRELAAKLDEMDTEGAFIPIAQVPAATLYPVSHAQKRLWLLDKLEEQAKQAYLIPWGVYLTGELDTDALKDAWYCLGQKHESLRTVFEEKEGAPWQRVLPEQDFPALEYFNAHHEGLEAGAIEQQATAYVNTPFNLEGAPLCRAALFGLGDKRWLLCIALHHIIADGWSVQVLRQDLVQAYAACIEGKQWDGVDSLPIQYKDYTAWQQAQLSGEALAGHRQFWYTMHAGNQTVMQLPVDKPRPAIKTYQGRIHKHVLDASATKLLRSLASEKESSMFMVVLSAVYVLLSKYTGQDDMVVGTPIAGRQHPWLEDQIGFYANTLALRYQINHNDSFEQVLDKVRNLMVEAYTHQVYPFDALVEELSLERDLSRSPMFDVLVLYNDFEKRHNSGLSGVDTTPWNLETGQAKYDLTFAFAEEGEGLVIALEYNDALFNKTTMMRMVEVLASLLQKIPLDTAQSIGKLNLIGEQEVNKLINGLNPPAMPYDAARPMYGHTEQMAESALAKTAFMAGKESITYGELNEQANQLAHYLMTNYKVGRGHNVAVLCSRSIDMPIALLAVLKSGAAYVPIDLAYPDERAKFMFQDAGATCVLTNLEGSNLPEWVREETKVCQMADNRLWLDEPTQNPQVLCEPEDTAYIIYTSGSTGQPKGVEIMHRNVAAFTDWALVEFEHCPDETVLAVTSYCFDLSIFEIFVSISRGRPVRLLENALELPTWVEKTQRSLINTVPSAISHLLDSGASLDKVAAINMAGEPIPLQIKQALSRHPIQTRNLYGPSEDTTYSTCYLFSSEHQNIPIGKPIANTKAYLCDERGQLVPRGAVGELWLGGAGVAKGYRGRTVLNKAVFMPDPFGGQGRVYCTGDLARWMPDGNLEFLGRKDQQVKIRGFRIEMGEIETNLMTIENIKEALITVSENPSGDKALVAYLEGAGMPTPEVIKKHLAHKLPAFMIPDALVQLEQFPRNQNGKIDRARLPKPTASAMGREYEAPVTDTEKMLASLWEVILGIPKVGRLNHFFEAGGHSMKASELLAKLHNQTGVSLPLQEVFLHPVLQDMAATIDAARPHAHEAFPKAPKNIHYPVSHGQKRLWLQWHQGDGQAAYNLFGAYRIKGALQPECLGKAVKAMEARHESLRTRFVAIDGEPRQEILPSGNQQNIFVYHADFEEGDLHKLASLPFDLQAGSLWQVNLWQSNEDGFTLSFSIHHIISDGWSLNVFIKELWQAYHAIAGGAEPFPAPLAIQYSDYSHWQSKKMRDKQGEQEKQYWLSRFEGWKPPKSLPTDFPHPDKRSFQGQLLKLSVDDEIYQKLQQQAQAAGASMFMTMLSSIYTWYLGLIGNNDLVLGIPVDGREHPALEGLIGFFVNTLPLRQQIDSHTTFRQLMQAVKQNVLEAHTHQGYPFDLLAQDLGATKTHNGRTPLFDVFVEYQKLTGSAGVGASGETLQVEPLPQAEGFSKFDLIFKVIETDEGLTIGLQFSTEVFQASTIALYLEQWDQLLHAVADSPDQKLGDVIIDTAVPPTGMQAIENESVEFDLD